MHLAVPALPPSSGATAGALQPDQDQELLVAEVEWLDPISGVVQREQQVLRVRRGGAEPQAAEAGLLTPDPLVVVTAARCVQCVSLELGAFVLVTS